MRRANRQYQVREMVCDWALDIPLGDTTVVLYFNSRNNAELVKTILEHEDAHPNEAVPFSLPQPSNEAPSCYQPDGDGCAYQCYDGDDEPIDKCKECPLCYSDKQRHHASPNEALSPYPDGDMSIISCPRCGSGEYLHNEDGNEQNYCGQCGQAIDWSRPPEGEGVIE